MPRSRPRPVRWLHFSDLHAGCRGGEHWWQAQHELQADLIAMAEQLGPPHLLLFSGDLSFSGQQKQFKLVDAFLDQVTSWLAPFGDRPLVVPVPGNHDLARPTAVYKFSVLDDDGPAFRSLHDELWGSQPNADFLQPLFTEYLAWLERRLVPAVVSTKWAELHLSHFLGDLRVTVSPTGFPLTVVGLNSTWRQYRQNRTDDEFANRLEISVEQLHHALAPPNSSSPLSVLDDCAQALLMFHQPPGWFSPAARAEFQASICPPDRFALCLYGHLHQPGIERDIGGRLACQSPSLFGLEHYGSKQEERRVGYTWGEIDEDGAVRIWPRVRTPQVGGEMRLLHNSTFGADPGAAGVEIRASESSRGSRRRPSPAPRLDLPCYLDGVIADLGLLKIRGIASRAGQARKAILRPIEKLYTPLLSRSTASERDQEVALLHFERAGGEPLADQLAAHPRLLIEGQPGAGKTTFLRLTATLLARDGHGLRGPGGNTWRQHFLALPADQPAKVPIYLRFAQLAKLLTAQADTPGHRDDRDRLLDLLIASARANPANCQRQAWRQLLEAGDAWLLLDGLDEVGEQSLRHRLLDVLADAAAQWPGPITVASRPVQTAELLAMGFTVAKIQPFDDGQIGRFLKLWVEALHGLDIHTQLSGEVRRYQETLRSAMIDVPRVRRLAANPVMLTCLCVIHWNEQELPEGRSRVYSAVLRWLLQARAKQRKAAGFTEHFAWSALAALALRMMDQEGGKLSLIGLEDAALAIEPVVLRFYTALKATADRRQLAKRWLEFECASSGIIEELAGRNLRFWHLTFQEALAAKQLASLGDGSENPEDDWWPIVEQHLEDPQWRETLAILPGTLLDSGGDRRVDRLLGRLLALRGDDTSLAADARVAAAVGAMLEPVKAYGYQPPSAVTAEYKRALKRSLKIFTKAGAAKIGIKKRLEVAAALGRAGDPRLRRPDWPPVSAVEGLRLGRYPVTVDEYLVFVDQERGYESRRWWDDDGWERRQQEKWTSPENWQAQLTTPNRPVVGVSWFEAMAYCAWLAKQRHEQVHLPTSAEWLAAADAPKGDYPWGKDKPTPELANFANHQEHPTPVGAYPAGAGPYGHLDLAGNVWEWCLDSDHPDLREFEKDDAYREIFPDLKEGDARFLRGGGWGSPARSLRSAIRAGSRPGAGTRISAFVWPSLPRAFDSCSLSALFRCIRGPGAEPLAVFLDEI